MGIYGEDRKKKWEYQTPHQITNFLRGSPTGAGFNVPINYYGNN